MFFSFHTINPEICGGFDAGAQPAVVLSSVGHLQVLDEEDPPLPVDDVVIAAALRQLLVSFVPGNISTGFGDLADQFHAVRLCSLHVGQVLGEPGSLLCDEIQQQRLMLTRSGLP